MKHCTYIIGKTKYNSYTELLRALENTSPLNTISDIVFSKFPKQEALSNLADKRRKEYNRTSTKDSPAFVNGEPSFDKVIGVLDYIDSGKFVINGHRPITPYVEADYIKSKTDLLIDLGMSLEDAENTIKEEIKNNKKILEDSLLFHDVFNDLLIASHDGLEKFVSKYRDLFKKYNNPELLLTNLYNGLHDLYILYKGQYPDSTIKRNLNLTAKTKDGDEIVGHIDLLIIGTDGTLHLYLFKTTSENPNQWINVKRLKYDYLLSFLKLILKANGFNVNSISLHLIPVELKYNDDYSNIYDIRVHPVYERTSSKNNTYSFDKIDSYTKVMIPNKSKMEPMSSENLSKADNILTAIFPTLNIKEEGIGQSARLWIQNAPSVDQIGTQQLVIKEVNTDHRYDVIINGKVYPIKSGRAKIANKEILNLVIKHINDLDDNKGYSILKLKDAIKASYKKGFVDLSEIKGLKGSEIKLNGLLTKYLNYTEVNGVKLYDWIMEDDLIDSSIIIFRNIHNDTLDFIDLTAFDINSIAKLSKGPGILGAYLYQDQLGLRSDYGAIEAVRTMVLINLLIPKLKDKKLGTIHVVSAINNSNYRTYNISDFNNNYFLKILEFVSNENHDLDIVNNFFNIEMEDGIDTILQTLGSILNGVSKNYAQRILDLGFDNLQNNINQEAKINALYNIINNIYQSYPSLQNPDTVERLLNRNDKMGNIAKLLNLVVSEYLSLRGESPSYKTEISWIDKNAFTTTTVPDSNLKIVIDNLQITHDNIASRFLKNYNKINKPFETFYKEIGYTAQLNMSSGNQAMQFNNLFKRDFETGKNTMTFKNPYDMSEDLTNSERKLLKQILFQILDIHSNHQIPFKSADDPKLADYVKAHPEYLWCPLIRASKATIIQNKDAWIAKIKNSWKRYKKALDNFDEFYNGVTAEEREILSSSDDFYKMTARNPFDLSIPNNVNAGVIEEKRRLMIEKYGPDFFETNVENIMKEFLVQHIGTQEFNKMLVGTKALMLKLYLQGITSGNSDVVDSELKWLQDYLKVNISKESPMSKESLTVIGYFLPVKHAVSHLLIAGNVKSMFRDLFEGVQLNFLRSILKYQTDLEPKYVAKAMSYVSTHSTTNAMAVNLLSKLCLKYRLSNTDVSRIAERSKTGRNGLVNIENGLYFTLRGPDFFNRMTLFVARCMLDGVWNAYSIDEDGDLKYDWKKDERFIQYANGNISSPLYNKLKALYLSKIRQWNLEHNDPEDRIDYNGNLPAPYTDKEILYIRNLGDNIYGSYDKSKRAMMEQYAFCQIFGMFTTWMNGIVNNYFMKSQRNGAFGYKRVQATDPQGHKLYFDDLNNIVTTVTNLPVYNDEPIVVLGIFGTLKTLYNVLTSDELKGFGDGYDKLKEYLKSDPHERANLRKLLSDLLMSLFYLLLYKYSNPAYKEFKKNMQDNPVLLNATVEVLYGGLSRAGDQNNGPLNIVTFLGENMNPPVYSLPTQLFGDLARSVFGEREWKYTMANFSGLTRSFRDTSISYLKSQEE